MASMVPIGIQDPPQHIHLLQNIGSDQQFFFSRSGPCDVDRREHPLVRHLPVKDDFRIARSLELFENHFVHARTRIDQRGRDDG